MTSDLSFALATQRENNRSDMGIDRRLPRIVQVGQAWGETLMDVRHMAPGEARLLLGGTRKKVRPIGTAVGLAPLVMGTGTTLATGEPVATAMGAAMTAFGLSAGFLRDEIRSEARGGGMPVPSDTLPSPDFPLVVRERGMILVCFAPGFDGYVEATVGGERRSLEELVAADEARPYRGGYRVELPDGGRAVVKVGEHAFFVREVHQASRVLPGVTQGFDGIFMSLFLLVAFAGLVLGVVIRSVPYDPSQEIVSVPDRFAHEVTIPDLTPPPEKKIPSGDPDAGEGAKAKGPEGKVGTKDSTVKKAKGTKVARRQAAMDKEIAESAGLMADLHDLESDTPMFGTGGIGVGASAFTGGVIGSQFGNQYGSGGLGSRGGMYGGGGDGEHLGGLGTRGRERGGSGIGSQGGYFGRKKNGAPPDGTGAAILIGALEKSQIDRVVKAHLAQIRFCYMKQLQHNPMLEGKVVVKFVIAQDGSVSSAKVHATSLDNPVVENCICTRFMKYQFPKPRGNGIVIVTYPFYFHRG